ncbi:hypothetical protein LEN26_002873 [Aphanomyces euteiches]|nr:hypothetical protein LEN26_002873 [Aphanomyces euteiches]
MNTLQSRLKILRPTACYRFWNVAGRHVYMSGDPAPPIQAFLNDDDSLLDGFEGVVIINSKPEIPTSFEPPSNAASMEGDTSDDQEGNDKRGQQIINLVNEVEDKEEIDSDGAKNSFLVPKKRFDDTNSASTPESIETGILHKRSRLETDHRRNKGDTSWPPLETKSLLREHGVDTAE